jgi:hypothetical protein
MTIALIFGVGAVNYPIGHFSRAGAGMFPLLISCMLFSIGLISVVRSRFVEAEPLKFNMKNVAFILLGLFGFALLSQYLNMIAAIIFLVFCVAFAGTSYSVARNLKISAGLIAIAFAFQHLLGMQLPLFKWIS